MKRAREGIEIGAEYPEPAWITRRGKISFLYRFFTGRPMDGRRWSDSTFWRSATRGEDHAWLRLAGWHRALIRSTVAYVLLVLVPITIMLFMLPNNDRWAWALLGAHVLLWVLLAAPVVTYRVLRSRGLTLPWLERITTEQAEQKWKLTWARVLHGRKEWEREKVLPVARTAAATLNRRYHPKEAAQWVRVPRNYREPGGGAVEVLLPGNFTLTEARQRTLANALGARLGMRDPSFRYELEGQAPRLLLTSPVLPPALVRPADVMAQLQRTEQYTFVLGKSGSEVLTVSLKEDSPHIAVSAGSGAGKSEQMKGLIAQAMHWGWSIIILDWKGESQEWAEQLHGVRYVRSIEALHDMMVSIGEEIEERRMLRSKEERDALPRILVVSEEWSITAPLLMSYWQHLRSTAEREERATMPLKSPAIEAGMKLNFTGRSLGFCQLLVAIRFSARVTNGNADLRESFGIILMSRWKAQTVKMLAPDIKPFPKKITTPGRWVAVNGDEAVVYQAILWSDEEAREWAGNGVPAPASPWSVRGSNVGTLQHGTQGDHLPDRVAAGNSNSLADSPHSDYLEGEVVPPVALRKLRDLVDAVDHLGYSLKDLQRAASGGQEADPDFPAAEGGTQFKGYLYDRTKVLEWARRKRAAQAAERERVGRK